MFVVRVADNFHYMEDDEVYDYGEFPTWQEAVTEARRIIDKSLAEGYRPGISADSLYDWYTSFGDDPYIVPELSGNRFSAWEYAKHQCGIMCVPEKPQGK